MRRTIHIPALPLDGSTGGGLLELIVEPGSAFEPGGPHFERLRGQGLGTAIDLATAWMGRHYEDHASVQARPIHLWLANPMAGLSNSAGASLGLVLGILATVEQWPIGGLIACGRVLPATGRLESDDPLSERLEPLLAFVSAKGGGERRTLPAFLASVAPISNGRTGDTSGANRLRLLRDAGIDLHFVCDIREALEHCRQKVAMSRKKRQNR
jgi:hypothetical protein